MKRLATAMALSVILVAGASSSSLAGGGRHHYGYSFGHHRGHGYGPAIAIGVGLLALSLSHSFTAYRYDYGYGYRGSYYDPGRVVYVRPRVRYLQPNVIAAPPRAVRRTWPRTQLPPGCRMIREYQTEVVVGGKKVEAYGDACLLADDTWRLGPPKIVPY